MTVKYLAALFLAFNIVGCAAPPPERTPSEFSGEHLWRVTVKHYDCDSHEGVVLVAADTGLEAEGRALLIAKSRDCYDSEDSEWSIGPTYEEHLMFVPE